MFIVSYGGKTPKVADSALVADTAYLIGDVEVGENTSIWPGVVLRADAAPIRVGSNCHIEENTVLHGLVTVGDEWKKDLGEIIRWKAGPAHQEEMLKLFEENAEEFLIEKLKESLNSFSTKLNFAIHIIANK